MKLNDLHESEKSSAILDKEGNILCPNCEKNLAIVTKYGMIRRCKKCEKNKTYSFMIAHDDQCGRRIC